MAGEIHSREQIDDAFSAGRRAGLAVASLALSLVAFLSLLGAEKAILAILLAVLALKGAMPGSRTRRMATAAIAIATMFLATVVVVLVAFWDKVVQFVDLLQKLS